MITFTEEFVLSRDEMPKGIPKNYRYYRQEIDQRHGYPVECGYLWLPPEVDIMAIEDLINGFD